MDHTIENTSSVNQATETVISEVKPAEFDLETLIPTFPILEVLDTTGIPFDSTRQPIEVYEVIIDDEKIEIVTDSTITVYRQPAPGETLHITPNADTTGTERKIVAALSGEVQDEVLEVTVPATRTFMEDVRLTLRWIAVIIVLVLIAYGVYLYVQAKRSRAMMEGAGKVVGTTLQTILENLNPKKK